MSYEHRRGLHKSDRDWKEVPVRFLEDVVLGITVEEKVRAD